MSVDTGGRQLAFIGTGVMGSRMAVHLIEAGYRVTAHNRTPAKAEPVLAAGASWAPTVAAAVSGADYVVSIVGTPDDVCRVYLAPDGVVATAPRGALVIDMTTSRPSLARQIHHEAALRGIDALDAPVSGGDVGAQSATLSIMVGGQPEAFRRGLPLLRAMGRTVVLQGPAGSGQHAKLCNQIVVANNMLGSVEALVYARRAGLDPLTLLESIGAGAAGSWSLANLYPRMVAGDFAPGFSVRHFLKDMRIARDEADAMGVELPGLALAESLYKRVAALEGGAEQGTQALYRAYAEAPPY
jgi:3-hydroxyisobutyrate dehydrogenase